MKLLGKVLRANAPKGQQRSAQGSALGGDEQTAPALKGQKSYSRAMPCGCSFALAGRGLRLPFTQGAALG